MTKVDKLSKDSIKCNGHPDKDLTTIKKNKMKSETNQKMSFPC